MSKSRESLTEYFPGCPVEAALRFIDGKWKGVILFLLLKDGMRFSQLQKRLPSVTHRMLTKQLRELEADGLISRTVHASVPPRVDYALTAHGRSFEPVILALKNWAESNMVCENGEARLRPAEEVSDSRV